MSETNPRSTANAWEEQKAKLKARFPQLTDEDLDFDVSERYEMLTRLQVKTNRTVMELRAIIGQA